MRLADARRPKLASGLYDLDAEARFVFSEGSEMARLRSSLRRQISAGALTAQWAGALELPGVAARGRLRSRQAVAAEFLKPLLYPRLRDRER